MKRIEVVQNGKIIAVYNWHSREFSYSASFFKKHGDILYVTNGSLSKVFSDTPYFFTQYLPIKGTANFRKCVANTGADPNDEFDLISKLCEQLPTATFGFRGVVE